MPPPERTWGNYRVERAENLELTLLLRLLPDLTVRVRPILREPEAFENNVNTLVRTFGIPEDEVRRELATLTQMVIDLNEGKLAITSDTVAITPAAVGASTNITLYDDWGWVSPLVREVEQRRMADNERRLRRSRQRLAKKREQGVNEIAKRLVLRCHPRPIRIRDDDE